METKNKIITGTIIIVVALSFLIGIFTLKNVSSDLGEHKIEPEYIEEQETTSEENDIIIKSVADNKIYNNTRLSGAEQLSTSLPFLIWVCIVIMIALPILRMF